MVEIRFSCSAASSAAFSCPQRPCKLLIIRGALKLTSRLLIGQQDVAVAHRKRTATRATWPSSTNLRSHYTVRAGVVIHDPLKDLDLRVQD